MTCGGLDPWRSLKHVGLFPWRDAGAAGRLAGLAVSLLLIQIVSADDWPFLRGPHYNGISAETGWTSEWPESGPEVAWRSEVGIGAASVVVSGGRVVAMGGFSKENEDVVSCLEADTGKVLWRFRYPCRFSARQFEGGVASTPTVDGSLVYTLGYDGQFHCLNLDDGKLVWRRHLIDDFGGRPATWKYAGSPLVLAGKVIVETGAEGDSTVALDRATGGKLWGRGDDLPGYASPIPFEWGGEQVVLVFKSRALVALRMDDGDELWRIDWRTYYDCNASTPTVAGDKLFVSTGYGGRSARGALFQLGELPPRELWVQQDLETKMNSAVVHEGHVYCISEKSRGQLMCFNLRDGSLAWSESSFAPYGTLMIAGGKLVILDEKGELVIAAATGGAYRELARAKVLEGRCWAMPVLANGRLYAKNNLGTLVCLDVRSRTGR